MPREKLIGVHGFTPEQVDKLEAVVATPAGAGLGGLLGILQFLSNLGTYAPQVVTLIQTILAALNQIKPAPAPVPSAAPPTA